MGRKNNKRTKIPRLPPCVISMGCACAGHCANPDPETPCDTTEHEHGTCCEVCGSMDVEIAMWVNPNTNAVGEDFGSWNAGDNTFCPQCDMNGRDPNPRLVHSGADLAGFLKARAKRLGVTVKGKRTPPMYDSDGQRIDEHGKAIDNDEGGC